VNSLLTALTFYALRRYAVDARLFAEGDIAALGPGYSIPAVVLYGLAIFLAFVNVYLALACRLATPLIYFIPTFIHGGCSK
jgi:hypothetical protein